MHKKDEVKILNWIIPEMGKGSGGHLNIFRFVSFLENMGFHNRIYLFNAPSLHDNESVSKFLKKYFGEGLLPVLIPGFFRELIR